MQPVALFFLFWAAITSTSPKQPRDIKLTEVPRSLRDINLTEAAKSVLASLKGAWSGDTESHNESSVQISEAREPELPPTYTPFKSSSSKDNESPKRADTAVGTGSNSNEEPPKRACTLARFYREDGVKALAEKSKLPGKRKPEAVNAIRLDCHSL